MVFFNIFAPTLFAGLAPTSNDLRWSEERELRRTADADAKGEGDELSSLIGWLKDFASNEFLIVSLLPL
ncbi:unnamed protein product [Leptosia nina]|uniref:Uncharacterized protein n=1 Tax=Leptosia nina TaxID=320188 RepID=A0AAV1J7L6_9NEOP